MSVRLHPHAHVRLSQRETTQAEIIETVERGKRFSAKFGRVGFRYNFKFDAEWQGTFYTTKRLEVIAVQEGQDWLVIRVIVKFF